jgi:hypothetical protein
MNPLLIRDAKITSLNSYSFTETGIAFIDLGKTSFLAIFNPSCIML